MDFKEYRGLTTRTLPDLGSQMLNSVHMSMGFASETYELDDAIDNEDKVNAGEEIGDKLWYLANYLNVNDIDFELEFYAYEPELAVEESDIVLMAYLSDCSYWESMLLDFDKKWLAYGKEKKDESVVEAVNELFCCYNDLLMALGLDPSLVMSRNIAKLIARFPNKFTQEDANHRDLVREREILEGK